MERVVRSCNKFSGIIYSRMKNNFAGWRTARVTRKNWGPSSATEITTGSVAFARLKTQQGWARGCAR